jgi:hypothetical protein
MALVLRCKVAFPPFAALQQSSPKSIEPAAIYYLGDKKSKTSPWKLGHLTQVQETLTNLYERFSIATDLQNLPLSPRAIARIRLFKGDCCWWSCRHYWLVARPRGMRRRARTRDHIGDALTKLVINIMDDPAALLSIKWRLQSKHWGKLKIWCV